VVVYTDDCICFSKAESTALQLIKDLKEDDFLLKDEGDAKDFLGVRIEHDPLTKKINMTQTGLIESILTDLDLINAKNVKDVPARQPLHPDSDGAYRQDSDKWSYRSVIGKMNYLAIYGHIKVTKIESAYNWADILTKATDKTTFERLRYLLMGW